MTYYPETQMYDFARDEWAKVYSATPGGGVAIEVEFDGEMAVLDLPRAIIGTWPFNRGLAPQVGDPVIAHYGRIFANGRQDSPSDDVRRTVEADNREVIGRISKVI